MPQLITPDVRVHASFVDAMAEFQDEGRGASGDDSTVGRTLRAYGPTWRDPQIFARYVESVRADSRDGHSRDGRPHNGHPRGTALRPEGHVPCTTLWYVEGDTYLGRLAIRHALTPWLLEYGGHIGYDVRPSRRGRGHAGNMPRAGLPVARRLGIDPALLTCDTDNTPSRKVIEACGGTFEDQRGGKLRYWVSTGGTGPH